MLQRATRLLFNINRNLVSFSHSYRNLSSIPHTNYNSQSASASASTSTIPKNDIIITNIKDNKYDMYSDENVSVNIRKQRINLRQQYLIEMSNNDSCDDNKISSDNKDNKDDKTKDDDVDEDECDDEDERYK